MYLYKISDKNLSGSCPNQDPPLALPGHNPCCLAFGMSQEMIKKKKSSGSQLGMSDPMVITKLADTKIRKVLQLGCHQYNFEER